MMHRHGYEGPKLSAAGMAFAWFVFREWRRDDPKPVELRWWLWKEAVDKFPMTEADVPPAAEHQRLPLFT